jgi:hypothetical protein
MASRATVLDHPGSKPSRYLRANRIKIALWIAVLEGILTLLGAIPHIAIYVLAVAAIGFYIAVGRKYTSPTARQLIWIFAASQLLAVLVPIVLFVAKWIAIVAIVVIAVGGLVILFADREKV